MGVELMRRDDELMQSKINSRKARICVIGVGYVGVPLAVASAKAGFDVIGVDVDEPKVASINKGVSPVEDPYSEKLIPDLVRKGKIRATIRLVEGAKDADVVIICVQTPLDKKGIPDLSFVKKVTQGLSRLLSNYKLIILESTSYPGTTQEVVFPILKRGKGRTSQGFGLVYSPERIDYGNPKYNVSKIPKVVGGIDTESTKREGRNESAVGRHGEDRQHNDATPHCRASRQRSEETREKTRQIYSVTLGACLQGPGKGHEAQPSRRRIEAA